MKRTRKTGLVLVALVVVVAVLVVALTGDAIQGFLDGLVAGSSNGV